MQPAAATSPARKHVQCSDQRHRPGLQTSLMRCVNLLMQRRPARLENRCSYSARSRLPHYTRRFIGSHHSQCPFLCLERAHGWLGTKQHRRPRVTIPLVACQPRIIHTVRDHRELLPAQLRTTPPASPLSLARRVATSDDTSVRAAILLVARPLVLPMPTNNPCAGRAPHSPPLLAAICRGHRPRLRGGLVGACQLRGALTQCTLRMQSLRCFGGRLCRCASAATRRQ